MKVNEVLLENKNNAFIKQHIQWLADQLDIKKLPKITLLNDPVDTTFGQYDPDTKSIKLVTGGRHPVDVLRTLAHELTHYKQDIENNLPDGAGETGTDQENEANANAGIVMRDFAQENPDQFGLDKGVAEASYPGNIGMMEVAKFFNMATPKEKIEFERLMNMCEKSKAWQLIQQVTGVKLQGKEFDLVAEHIVKHGSQFRLLSKKGKNLGTFPSHKAAAKHEGEVEYFKAHPKK